MSLKEEIKDRVEQLKGWRKGPEFIQKQLSKELNRKVPLELIHEIIRDMKNEAKKSDENIAKLKQANSKKVYLDKTKDAEKVDGGLKSFVKETEEEANYEFNHETDHYIFKHKTGLFPMLRTTLCAICNSFSKYGENLNQQEVMMKYKLTSQARQIIKGGIKLYKTSPNKDPMTIEMELSGDVNELLENINSDVRYANEAKYKQILERANRAYKDRLIKTRLDKEYQRKKYYEDVKKIVKEYNLKDFSDIVPKTIDNNDVLNIVFGDLHLGIIGTDGIVTRIGKITKYMLERKEKYIKIKVLGDLFECVVVGGEMHKGQRGGMETLPDSQVIGLAIKLFEEMLYQLYSAGKVVVVDTIPGNHDRFTVKCEDDPDKLPHGLVFDVLKMLLDKTNIEINIHRQETVPLIEGKIKYIISHGYKLQKGDVTRIIGEYAEKGYHLVLLTAHQHHKEVELNAHTTWIQIPALAPGSKYSNNKSMSSLSGFVIVKENEDGLVDFTTKTMR